MPSVTKGGVVPPAVGLAALTFQLAFVLAAGCSKTKDGAAAAEAPSGAALASAGRAVFNNNGCDKCHVIGGQGGRMGPDLSRVGAGTRRTAEWLVAHIKNPRAHSPGSRMPAYEGKISDKDLLALGAYLASLK